MTVRSQMRGHKVWHDGQVWRHADDDSLAPASGGQERPCTHCGLTAEDGYGPDPCLGWIDGVDGACCGHGQPHTRACVRRPRPNLRPAVAWMLLAGAASWLAGLFWIGVL